MSDTKYCYPHTDILKNKLDIRDKEKLINAEIRLTSINIISLQTKPIQGRFDFDHLCKIHNYIFGDLFVSIHINNLTEKHGLTETRMGYR